MTPYGQGVQFFVYRFVAREGKIQMGSQQNNGNAKKRRKGKNPSRGNWGGYVECPLGKAERDDFRNSLLTGKIDVFDQMSHLVDAGVNISCSWNEHNEAYIAKATMTNEDDGKVYMLSAFHEEIDIAWKLLFFKHFILLQESWFDRVTEDAGEENWG